MLELFFYCSGMFAQSFGAPYSGEEEKKKMFIIIQIYFGKKVCIHFVSLLKSFFFLSAEWHRKAEA